MGNYQTRENGYISWPVSIILSVIVISIGIWYSSRSLNLVGYSTKGDIIVNLAEVTDISEGDQILNNNHDADVYIVEYSDIYCPSCREMRKEIRNIVQRHNGKVGWVFRNFPLSIQHPLAYYPATAGQCLDKKKGNEAFWQFIDKLFLLEESGLVNKEVAKREALRLGLSEKYLDECVVSDEVKDIVLAQRLEAYSAGARGTPFLIIANKKGELRIMRDGLPTKDQINTIVMSLL